jgi:UDP-2,3-diacylglucosamine pyrophosphatase LpxH
MSKDIRPRINAQQKRALDYLRTKERRILVIGDLHCPFELDGYFEFCLDTYDRFACNQVIFIGDLIDSHATSRHETDPNGLSAKTELEQAIADLQKWREAFPVADVIVGNHDRVVMRRAFSSSIPSMWIKSFNEVLGTSWNWSERMEYDGVQYVHGEGGTARTKAKNDLQSTVQGHIHTQAYVEWMVGNRTKLFSMQVGCGLDRETYAAAYAKHYKKQAIGCGVVIGGHTAINCLMPL